VLYSLHIIWILKSRGMRWAGHVAHLGDRGDACRVFGGGDLRERDYLENLGVDGRIILSGCSRSGMGDVDWIDLDQGRNRWHL